MVDVCTDVIEGDQKHHKLLEVFHAFNIACFVILQMLLDHYISSQLENS